MLQFFFHVSSKWRKISDDLALEECIVAELNFGRKKIFFTVLYRNPMDKSDNPEFVNFQNVEGLGVTNDEGTQLNNLFSKLYLTQFISESTHFPA